MDEPKSAPTTITRELPKELRPPDRVFKASDWNFYETSDQYPGCLKVWYCAKATTDERQNRAHLARSIELLRAKPPRVLDGFQWVAIVVQDVDLLKDPDTRDRANVLGALFEASAIRSEAWTATQLANDAKTTSKPVIWDPLGRHSTWVVLEEILPVLPKVEPKPPPRSVLIR